MQAETLAILQLAESLGCRDALLKDLRSLVSAQVYFSPNAVAERYDVSLSTIKLWKSKGLLTPSFKIKDGTARYTLADLDRFEQLGLKSGK